jgi:hypothetical protein
MRFRWRTITFFSTVAVIAVVGPLTWITATRAQSTAFTIQYNFSKNELSTGTVVARRSDGSRSESFIRTDPTGKQYNQRIIWDAGRRARIVLEAITESVTTYPLWASQIAALRRLTSDCGLGANAESSTILGEKVFEKVTPSPLPDRRRLEEWVAPRLGCLALRERTLVPQSSGGDTVLSWKEAVFLTFKDPDPALFQVPAWPERRPSEVFAEYSRRFPSDAVTPNPLVDKAYLTAQSIPAQEMARR